LNLKSFIVIDFGLFMEPNEEQLISIADKMLEQLEREYWEAQDKDKTIECP